MVSVQFFDKNDPQSAPSSHSSPMNEAYNDSLSQLRPSTSIDGLDLVEKYFEFEIDSDVESILTDSTYSDDSSLCSVDFDSESDNHVDYARRIPKMPLTARRKQSSPLCGEPKQATNCRRNNGNDELASVISYDSLVDAKKRGIVGTSIDQRLKSRNQQFKKPLVPKQEQPEIVFDFASDEETVYNISLK